VATPGYQDVELQPCANIPSLLRARRSMSSAGHAPDEC
jgi:hypothetical protein